MDFLDYDCEPDILELENKFHSADFNCNNCNQTDCVYWALYNNILNQASCIQHDSSKLLK